MVLREPVSGVGKTALPDAAPSIAYGGTGGGSDAVPLARMLSASRGRGWNVVGPR